MTPVRLVVALTALALVFVAGTAFAPLTLFDLVVPKDDGSSFTRDVVYGEAPRHTLDIYRPEGDTENLPVALFYYGGSWNSGSKDDYSFVGRALAAQGFVTVIADYRLVPEVRYPAFVEDGARALAWVEASISAYGGDPDRIGVLGHSAGAYIALMLALDPEFGRAAGFAGEISAVAGLSGPYDFLPLDTESTVAAFGEAVDLGATQPLSHVRADAPPTLLLHGAEDTLVFPRNSVALAEALTGESAEATLGLYPGIDHPGTLLALSRWFRDGSTIFSDLVAFLRARV